MKIKTQQKTEKLIFFFFFIPNDLRYKHETTKRGIEQIKRKEVTTGTGMDDAKDVIC